MRETTYINFIGGASVGKSLMSALTYAEMKSLHLSVEMVQEYAKMLVYMENFEMLNCQYMVSMEQYKRLKALKGKVDYVCCDSPMLVGLFYNRHYETNVCNVEKTEEMIVSKMKELEPNNKNRRYIFLERNEEYPFEQEGRVHGEEESKRIDQQFKLLLEEFGIEYLSVKSDKASIPVIIDYIVRIERN